MCSDAHLLIKNKYGINLTIRIHKVIHTLGITMWINVDKKEPERDFHGKPHLFRGSNGGSTKRLFTKYTELSTMPRKNYRNGR